MNRYIVLVLLALGAACGEDDTIAVNLRLPDTSDLQCGSTTLTGVSAALYISGNLPVCNLTVVNGEARGDCPNIPTGIDRYLVLRYAASANGSVLRYAVTTAALGADTLEGKSTSVDVAFVDDDSTGFFIDSDADVAQLGDLLYGPVTSLRGAQCFARSLIAADAGTSEVEADCLAHVDVAPVLDRDSDGCTNLRELCDGTSPVDASSAGTCSN